MTPDIIRKCIVLSGGLELWVDADRADKLSQALSSGSAPKFFTLDGQLVNTFEVRGIFTADAMEEQHRRKNGQWKCMKGRWHEKGHSCECKAYTETVTAHVEGVGKITYKR